MRTNVNNRTNRKVNVKGIKILLIVYMIGSMFFCLIGIASYFNNVHKPERCTEKVTATCVDYKVHISGGRNARRRRTYRPIFSYKYNGKTYEVKYEKGYSELKKNTFEKGEKYTLLVNPNNPREFVIKGNEDELIAYSKVLPIGSGMITILLIVMYCAISSKHRKNNLASNREIKENNEDNEIIKDVEEKKNKFFNNKIERL